MGPVPSWLKQQTGRWASFPIAPGPIPFNETYLLRLEKSYHPDAFGNRLFLKMDGHEIFKYAVRTVAEVVKQSLDKAGLSLSDVKKVLIHPGQSKDG